MPFVERQLLRHAVATIRYRGERTLAAAPEDFGAFEVGSGARTPLEILRHVNDLLGWSCRLIEEGPMPMEPKREDDWRRAVESFGQRLDELDRCLRATEGPRESLERLLQGPLADVFTHVGQLALLRRLAGSPLEKHSYYRADIRVPERE